MKDEIPTSSYRIPINYRKLLQYLAKTNHKKETEIIMDGLKAQVNYGSYAGFFLDNTKWRADGFCIHDQSVACYKRNLKLDKRRKKCLECPYP